MDEPKTIEVLYFALYRDFRGTGSETVTTSATTPHTLYRELQLDQALPLDTGSLRVAVNDEFTPWNTPLKTGDRVAFIAPVAGG